MHLCTQTRLRDAWRRWVRFSLDVAMVECTPFPFLARERGALYIVTSTSPLDDGHLLLVPMHACVDWRLLSTLHSCCEATCDPWHEHVYSLIAPTARSRGNGGHGNGHACAQHLVQDGHACVQQRVQDCAVDLPCTHRIETPSHALRTPVMQIMHH